MTTSSAETSDPEANETLLSVMAQQVAQQSRTTALHIAQHDEIEAVAQERANAVIDRVRADLLEAHEAALSRAREAMTASNDRELHRNLTNIAGKFNETLQELADQHARILKDHVAALEKLGQETAERHDQEMEQIRVEIRTSREQAQEQRREMDRAHAANLAAVENTLTQERQQQEQQYQQFRADTNSDVKQLLDGALEENARHTDSRLEETGAAMVQQGRETHEALAASNARWRRLSMIVIGVSGLATAIATAALAIPLL